MADQSVNLHSRPRKEKIIELSDESLHLRVAQRRLPLRDAQRPSYEKFAEYLLCFDDKERLEV